MIQYYTSDQSHTLDWRNLRIGGESFSVAIWHVHVTFSKLQTSSNVLFGEQWLPPSSCHAHCALWFRVLLMLDS